MIKLNLTKEQVTYFQKEYPHQKGDLCEDWLAMHAELARLNKAMDRVIGDLEGIIFGKLNSPDYNDGIKAGQRFALDILRKHFPELKEDIEDEDLLEEEDLQIEERERRKQEGG